MTFDSVETKWNADNEKLRILMTIEMQLEEAFLDCDVNEIYKWLGSYRRHANTKFRKAEQDEIIELFDELKKRLEKANKDKDEESIGSFYSYAEGLFLKISQKIKESGIYYREGRNASHAVLER
jgi:hypothetical protein